MQNRLGNLDVKNLSSQFYFAGNHFLNAYPLKRDVFAYTQWAVFSNALLEGSPFERAQRATFSDVLLDGTPFERAQRAAFSDALLEGSPFERAQRAIFSDALLDGTPFERAQQAFRSAVLAPIERERRETKITSPLTGAVRMVRETLNVISLLH